MIELKLHVEVPPEYNRRPCYDQRHLVKRPFVSDSHTIVSEKHTKPCDACRFVVDFNRVYNSSPHTTVCCPLNPCPFVDAKPQPVVEVPLVLWWPMGYWNRLSDGWGAADVEHRTYACRAWRTRVAKRPCVDAKPPVDPPVNKGDSVNSKSQYRIGDWLLKGNTAGRVVEVEHLAGHPVTHAIWTGWWYHVEIPHYPTGQGYGPWWREDEVVKLGGAK